MKVILIEDETIIGEMIAMYLTDEGHQVRRADNGLMGLEEIPQFNPDIAIIDYMLPDSNGIEICKEIRKFSFMPVIIISANTDVSNLVDALSAGADDYLCKPFSMKELVARLIAQFRRSNYSTQDYNKVMNKSEEMISIDNNFRTIRVNGRNMEVTVTEFEIMQLFIKYPGRVFSRDDLITYLRGGNTMVNERSVDVHVAKLRNKIERDPKSPKLIKTVWGIGYKYFKS